MARRAIPRGVTDRDAPGLARRAPGYRRAARRLRAPVAVRIPPVPAGGRALVPRRVRRGVPLLPGQRLHHPGVPGAAGGAARRLGRPPPPAVTPPLRRSLPAPRCGAGVGAAPGAPATPRVLSP